MSTEAHRPCWATPVETGMPGTSAHRSKHSIRPGVASLASATCTLRRSPRHRPCGTHQMHRGYPQQRFQRCYRRRKYSLTSVPQSNSCQELCLAGHGVVAVHGNALDNKPPEPSKQHPHTISFTASTACCTSAAARSARNFVSAVDQCSSEFTLRKIMAQRSMLGIHARR